MARLSQQSNDISFLFRNYKQKNIQTRANHVTNFVPTTYLITFIKYQMSISIYLSHTKISHKHKEGKKGAVNENVSATGYTSILYHK